MSTQASSFIKSSRPSSSSLATQNTNSSAVPTLSDTKGPKVSRENQFIHQHGSKLHTFGRDKAPYPISYDRDSLEMWCMDHALIMAAQRRVSFVDFKDNPPKRCLDVATGLGDWVIDAAKQWPDCTFVGYDLVNVQIPLHAVDPSIANRIEWVHGNFLRVKLPFEDEEFDHIRLSGVAFAVPENKWLSLYEELSRVLRRGGTIEQVEEDALFPVLPRWFTDPLHSRSRGQPAVQLPDGSLRSAFSPPAESALSHEYELLQKLFYAVFDNRFINPLPSSYLPSPFSTYFSHVLAPPILSFPMPPLAPLTPLPPGSNIIESPPLSYGSLTASREHSSEFLPPINFDAPVDMTAPSLDPVSPPSLSSIPIDKTPSLSSSVSSNILDSLSSFSVTSSPPSSITGSPSPSSVDLSLSWTKISSTPRTRASSLERTTSASVSSINESRSSGSSRFSRSTVPATFVPPEESTSVGGQDAIKLLPMEELRSLEEHSLYMHLHRAVTFVMSLKEAMWEELQVKVAKKDESLAVYGWLPDDFNEEASRAKFDAMIEQYKKDMRVRVSLWNSMVLNGWEYPPRGPLSKAEVLEEELLRRAILEARHRAKGDEFEGPSRSSRLLVGIKAHDTS